MSFPILGSSRGSGGLKKLDGMPTSKYNLFGIIVCMVTCLEIGYLFGSANTNTSTTSCLTGQIKSGTASTRRYAAVANIANSTTVVAGAGGAHHAHHNIGKNGTSVIEEIMPPGLLPSYAPDKLQFDVTRSMLRQSRPVVGNTQRLHSYLDKLRSGICTTVLFLGGSVTAGHNGGGPANAYPRRVVEWLDERYPCVAADGTRGRHEEMTSDGASDSMSHFVIWSTIASIEKFDLVFVEFNVNDNFVKTLPHALEDKGDVGANGEYASSWYFEVLLRRLLLLRKPDPVAVVTFNADYVGRVWAMPPWYNPVTARKQLFRSNQEPLKIWVSSMYGVPVFSAVMWMLPLAGRRGMDWQFNRTINPHSTSEWHADACCHPSPKGHRVLGLVVAYCVTEEERAMLSSAGERRDAAERDLTADDVPTLRDPLYLSPEEEGMYVRNDGAYHGADFSDPNGEESWRKSVVASDGWTWYADNKDEDKYGFIADGIEGGQHIAVSLSGQRHGRVEVSYVVSYENFGVSLAWLGASNETARHFCKEKSDGALCYHASPASKDHQMQFQCLQAIWADKASIPKVELLTQRLLEGENKTLHICLTPHGTSKQQVGEENKFKLMGVRVY